MSEFYPAPFLKTPQLAVVGLNLRRAAAESKTPLRAKGAGFIFLVRERSC